MNFLNFLAETGTAATGTDATTTTSSWAAMFTMIIPLALMVLVFWLLIIRPEKKRTKELQNMLDSLQIADEVVTNGGIVGLVISLQKDTVLIETGSDRTKIRVLRSAIAKCNTTHDVVETVDKKPKDKSKSKKDIK